MVENPISSDVTKKQADGPFSKFASAKLQDYMGKCSYSDMVVQYEKINEGKRYAFFLAKIHSGYDDLVLEYGYDALDDVLIRRNRVYTKGQDGRVLTHAEISFQEQDQEKKYTLIVDPDHGKAVGANLIIKSQDNNKNITTALAFYSKEFSHPKEICLTTSSPKELSEYYPAPMVTLSGSIISRIPGMTMKFGKDASKSSLFIFPKKTKVGTVRQGESFNFVEALPCGYRYDRSIAGDKTTVTRMNKSTERSTVLSLPSMNLTKFYDQVKGRMDECFTIRRDCPMDLVARPFFGV
jgi:hypothetical protein